MERSNSTAISIQQLAKISGRCPEFFSRPGVQLPEPTPMHTGGPGRPQLCYPIEELAEFILERTGFLSEAECRLRLALAPEARRQPRRTNTKNIGQFRLVTDARGRHVVVPYDLSTLCEADRTDAEQALAFEKAQKINEVKS